MQLCWPAKYCQVTSILGKIAVTWIESDAPLIKIMCKHLGTSERMTLYKYVHHLFPKYHVYLSMSISIQTLSFGGKDDIRKIFPPQSEIGDIA